MNWHVGPHVAFAAVAFSVNVMGLSVLSQLPGAVTLSVARVAPEGMSVIVGQPEPVGEQKS